MIRLKAVVIGWDLVPNSTGYSILRDGVKVSSTKTALQAQIGVSDGVDHQWTVVAVPSGVSQGLKADWA